MEQNATKPVIGLHLAGPNSERTCIVAIEKNSYNQHVILELYEKIGSFGSLFSDERVIELVKHIKPAESIFTDAPLSSPPCVSCVREVCPGVVSCEDLSVAYMLHLTKTLRDKKKPRKRKPLNPQAHRVWDAVNMIEDLSVRLEPTYSSNRAPLVVRAKTLQQRFNPLDSKYVLMETSVAKSLINILETLELDGELLFSYKSFETGSEVRRSILEEINERNIIILSELQIARISKSLQLFNAFICAYIAILFQNKKTTEPPTDFITGESWVYTPFV
jgi:hypothetical protein